MRVDGLLDAGMQEENKFSWFEDSSPLPCLWPIKVGHPCKRRMHDEKERARQKGNEVSGVLYSR